MMNEMFPLLQLCDSNFPSGAFSHSFGLETYIQENVISDKGTFSEALSVYVRKQLVYTDGLACCLAFEALENGSRDKILEIDHMVFASSFSAETRMGNRRIGERMAKLCMDLYPSVVLAEYLEQIKKKNAYGHSAFVFAMVAHHLNVKKETAVGTYLFAGVSSLIQNAVRGIPLGQTDGQKILVEIQPVLNESVKTILSLTLDDLCAVSPGLEIAQMRHERLHVRLFMS